MSLVIQRDLGGVPRAVHPVEGGYVTYASLRGNGQKCLAAQFYDKQWTPGQEIVELGGNINAENPTIVDVGGKIFVCFCGDSPFDNQETCMWLHEHGTSRMKPVYAPRGMSRVEKNWAPFVYKGKLVFVYSLDPYVLLQCDTDTGKCIELKGSLPADVGAGVLRGGTNLIDTGEYIEGLCVSKHLGHALTHKVRLSHKLDLLRVSEPVREPECALPGVGPRSMWRENGRTYVSGVAGVHEYIEPSWTEKVKTMVERHAHAHHCATRGGEGCA